RDRDPGRVACETSPRSPRYGETSACDHLYQFFDGEELRQPVGNPQRQIQARSGRLECLHRTGDVRDAPGIRTDGGRAGQRVHHSWAYKGNDRVRQEESSYFDCYSELVPWAEFVEWGAFRGAPFQFCPIILRSSCI